MQASQGASKNKNDKNIFDSMKKEDEPEKPKEVQPNQGVRTGGKRTRKLPMIDFDEQDAYIK